jgi:hypothetical protein
MRHKNPIALTLLAALLLAPAACANLSKEMSSLTGGGGGVLDQATIADGLREALRVGSERAVGQVSKADGFLANKLIRIAMPSELETSMNRAAEKASAEATAIFWDAVQGLTIDDAKSILDGGKHAATKLLRDKTSTQLESRIHPIVTQKMNEVGLSQLYGDLADKYNALPLGQKPAMKLDEYVTGKTLDGVFTVLAKEEERIRADPVARTSEILQRVFK